jgi:hypothetical protein
MGGALVSPLSIVTVGLFVVLFTAVLAWSPLARGLVREAVRRPNEPCTFTKTNGRKVELHRKVLPEQMQERGDLGPSPNDAVGSSPHFKLVLGAVFILTLLALVALVALVFAPPSAQLSTVSGTCEKAFIFGFSALIGLIGGRAIK